MEMREIESELIPKGSGEGIPVAANSNLPKLEMKRRSAPGPSSVAKLIKVADTSYSPEEYQSIHASCPLAWKIIGPPRDESKFKVASALIWKELESKRTSC